MTFLLVSEGNGRIENLTKLHFLPIGFTRVLSNSSAFCGKWLGLYGGKLRRSKILDVEVLKGVELVVAVVVAARGDPEKNIGHLVK